MPQEGRPKELQRCCDTSSANKSTPLHDFLRLLAQEIAKKLAAK